MGLLEAFASRIEYGGRPAVQLVVIEITERRRLEREIIEISNRERERIAGDLHDELGQQLTGIGLLAKVLEQNLAGVSPARASEAGEITELVMDAVAKTRDLARGLLPVDIAADGLEGALTEVASHTERVSEVRCRFECERPVLVHDHTVATHLHRIAQEAVSNALRHSGAANISIRLESAGEALTLSVADDGIGIQDSSDRAEGLGLRLMKHRADLMGGTLEIRSPEPQGTVVTCSVRAPGKVDEEG